MIHAIARSRTEPERAEKIVKRLEEKSSSGDSDIRPDVVCYDALINAYGWSSVKGRSRKCYAIFLHMLDQYRTGKNRYAKPDVITCNSVLNSCAYEEAADDDEKAEMIDMVVDVLETYQTNAPKFGWPNHVTYSHVLLAISKHLSPTDEKRQALAEATFWQCCDNGHVSVLVVNQLYRALPSWEHFKGLMGEALFSEEGDAKLGFNLRKLPPQWTRYVPMKRRQRLESRPSTKRPSMEVTKETVNVRKRQRRRSDGSQAVQ